MPLQSPPIRPYISPLSPSAPPIPLTTPLDTSLLSPYLPPLRTLFLSTSPPSSLLSNPTRGPLPFPHLTLTYAQSLDSQLSLAPGMQTLLSGPETKGMTHFLRTRHDAILVGAGTALADDPGLNSRFESVVGEGLENQPIPVVLDFQGLWRPREGLRVFTLARQGLGRAPWWVVGAGVGGGDVGAGVEAVERVGGRVLRLERRKDWGEILGVLAECGVRSVMVEGGASVINGLLEERNQRFVSSVIVTIAPTYLGEGGVVVSPKRTGEGNAARLSDVRWLPVGEDVVMAGRLVTGS